MTRIAKGRNLILANPSELRYCSHTSERSQDRHSAAHSQKDRRLSTGLQK